MFLYARFFELSTTPAWWKFRVVTGVCLVEMGERAFVTFCWERSAFHKICEIWPWVLEDFKFWRATVVSRWSLFIIHTGILLVCFCRQFHQSLELCRKYCNLGFSYCIHRLAETDSRGDFVFFAALWTAASQGLAIHSFPRYAGTCVDIWIYSGLCWRTNRDFSRCGRILM